MKEIEESQTAKVSLKLPNNSEKNILCKVKQVYKDRIALVYPKDAMSYADYLEEGTEIPVEIYSSEGVNVFKSMILDSPTENDFIIEYSCDYIHVQRRHYARTKLETKIIIVREKFDNIITKTVDIGGGGIRFVYKGRFYKDEKVDIRLFLPLQLKPICASGYIKEADYLGKNEHIVYFTNISRDERQIIVKKCFELDAALERLKENSDNKK